MSLRKSLRWIQSSDLRINLCGLLCGDVRLVVSEPAILKTIVVILFDTSLDLHIENPDLADQGAVETLLLQWSVSDVSYHGEETSRRMENCTGFSSDPGETIFMPMHLGIVLGMPLASRNAKCSVGWHGSCLGVLV